MPGHGAHDRGSDADLVGRVRKGETRLFAQLVGRYQDSVYGMARRFTGSEADAEDIAQEAFLRAFRGLDSFKGEAQFSTWLYRISWNLCADWSRRHARLRKKTRPIEDAEDLPDERGQVEKRLLDEEDRVRVRDAVQGLDERYREPVVLLYFQKLSYEQIAAVMDIPLKTVETRLYRARGMLREMLERDSRGGDA